MADRFSPFPSEDTPASAPSDFRASHPPSGIPQEIWLAALRQTASMHLPRTEIVRLAYDIAVHKLDPENGRGLNAAELLLLAKSEEERLKLSAGGGATSIENTLASMLGVTGNIGKQLAQLITDAFTSAQKTLRENDDADIDDNMAYFFVGASVMQSSLQHRGHSVLDRDLQVTGQLLLANNEALRLAIKPRLAAAQAKLEAHDLAGAREEIRDAFRQFYDADPERFSQMVKHDHEYQLTHPNEGALSAEEKEKQRRDYFANKGADTYMYVKTYNETHEAPGMSYPGRNGNHKAVLAGAETPAAEQAKIHETPPRAPAVGMAGS
jgi:hypothetical protein